MQLSSPHTFHIPVMGLAYTIDTPVKVARFGINSVISIIEDNLVERMRSHYYKEFGKNYLPISTAEEDYRALRITDYLNLVNEIVTSQIEKLRTSAFETGGEIIKYFEMLPEKNMLKQLFTRMNQSHNDQEKKTLQQYLRDQIQPGSIDVNIMTKVDRINVDKQGNTVHDGSDAVAALRGYIHSNLTNSSIIFSAGLNPRLFNYLEKTTAFQANTEGTFNKKIIIKVSDYRSALIQGKYLAKKGIWVSEFRIESGLNCGGHAFATDGTLLGPILEEFKTKKEELIQALFTLYNGALKQKGMSTFEVPHALKITVQGGVGTADENEFLLHHYGVESIGWGTPFLLCPEATTVDKDTLELLSNANETDVVLSKNSPLGVRFNYLKGTTSDKEKLARILKRKPGSPCTEKHLVSNTEFTTEPICTASSNYQKRKIEQLQSQNLTTTEYQKKYEEVVSKECLCVGLINAAIIHYNLPSIKNLKAVTICPGPNIAYFNKVVSLSEMADHIYGRTNLLSGINRPHMFIKELQLNVAYLKEQCEDVEKNEKNLQSMISFGNQLLAGIDYYKTLPETISNKDSFCLELEECQNQIDLLLQSLRS
jgi:NAD(P)H-dependent flavin oxidoreductase YrpB (nitropropane dioxygenase family)